MLRWGQRSLGEGQAGLPEHALSQQHAIPPFGCRLCVKSTGAAGRTPRLTPCLPGMAAAVCALRHAPGMEPCS